jgi:hypothetical protein
LVFGSSGADRRYINSNAAYTGVVQARNFGIRNVFIYIDDSFTACADLAHGVKHASVVPAIGAWLYENHSLDT